MTLRLYALFLTLNASVPIFGITKTRCDMTTPLDDGVGWFVGNIRGLTTIAAVALVVVGILVLVISGFAPKWRTAGLGMIGLGVAILLFQDAVVQIAVKTAVGSCLKL